MYKFGANSIAFYFDKIGVLNVIYIVYSAINGYYNEITCKNYVFWYLGIFEKYLLKKYLWCGNSVLDDSATDLEPGVGREFGKELCIRR